MGIERKIHDQWKQSLKEDPLVPLIEKYKEASNSPEVITELWRGFLPDFSIPDCDWTEEEIAEPVPDLAFIQHEGMMVPVIDELQGRDGLIRLGKLYLQMASWSVQEDTPISSNRITKPGWVKIEGKTETPNQDSVVALPPRKKEPTPLKLPGYPRDLPSRGSKAALRIAEFFKSFGAVGQTLEIFILGSQMNKRLTGRYFNQQSSSRLTGSQNDRDGISARFSVNGYLQVYKSLFKEDQHPNLGARSMILKKSSGMRLYEVVNELDEGDEPEEES